MKVNDSANINSSPARPKRRVRRGSGRATIRQVAERAGVAMITVSRALTRPQTVSADLRGRIEAAVRELGYVPNRFAGGLASERTRVIPVVIPSLSNRVFADIVRGAQDVLTPRGYQILFSNTFRSLDEEEAIVSALLGWVPDGIILSGVDHSEGTRARLDAAGIPVVEALELGERPIDINIGFSHFEAGRTMTRHLIERGYRRIGFVGTQLDADFRATRRLAGWRAALAEAGLPEAWLAAYPEPSSYRKGAEAVAELAERGLPVDAIFFHNDVLAVGAILECQRRGIAVPDDLAVGGFNGHDIGAEINPALTTILSPRRRMGQLAAEALLDRIEGDAPRGRQVDVGFELLPRQSA